MRFLQIIGIVIIVLLTLELYTKGYSPKYKENECATTNNKKVRKIIKVKQFMYEYCVLKYNKCSKYYQMRIYDFDNQMKYTKCKGAGQ